VLSDVACTPLLPAVIVLLTYPATPNRPSSHPLTDRLERNLKWKSVSSKNKNFSMLVGWIQPA